MGNSPRRVGDPKGVDYRTERSEHLEAESPLTKWVVRIVTAGLIAATSWLLMQDRSRLMDDMRDTKTSTQFNRQAVNDMNVQVQVLKAEVNGRLTNIEEGMKRLEVNQEKMLLQLKRNN